MTARIIACAGLIAALAGCGDNNEKTTLAPPIKNLGGSPPADSAPAIDGKTAGGGENVFGPKRGDADAKIAEIRANSAYSEDLKKQLIDEVERTYKEAQAGVKAK